jgi:hypothetical protein
MGHNGLIAKEVSIADRLKEPRQGLSGRQVGSRSSIWMDIYVRRSAAALHAFSKKVHFAAPEVIEPASLMMAKPISVG